MRRLLLVALVALVATGAASADTFEVVGDQPAASAATALPSALAPNDVRRHAAASSSPHRRRRSSSAGPTCCRSGRRPARRTASRGRCSRRSTRSSPTSAATWARARRARSAGCSSCRTRGRAGASTRTATALPDPWNAEDAIYSAARYLAATGGATDISSAVFSYNHAQWYVDEVLQLAQQYAGGSADFGPALEAAQADLDAAKQAVLDANQRVLDAQAKVTELQARADELLAGGDVASRSSATGSPHRSSRHSRTSTSQAAAGRGRRPASRSCRRPRTRSPPRATGPRARRSRRAPARCSARRATPAATSSPSPAAPASSGSVTPTTTIPAADIAAPEGTQLYALSDGTVQDAWQRAERPLRHRLHDRDHRRPRLDVLPSRLPRADGRRRRASWPRASRSASSARPAMRPGRTCTCSCSPRPPTRRTRPWFQSFAGSAFSWSDGFQTKTRSGPVFEVVDERLRLVADARLGRGPGRAVHDFRGLGPARDLPKGPGGTYAARSYRASWR